ncbi:hypothetical protein [Streptomyces sp. CFMR 7]|uniref:hypothetical protein n=1 Tax=Streptomyces sp. CFMR 7 TaxID=1649184 RepID=UPI001642ADF8|nr:hypothetical protein [Streptomyces sp. CFMR 7]
MKKDPLVWGALAAVLVVLASAEYDLARACGFGKYVAAGVPAALDIYAVRALRAKRDVLIVVVALVAVNAASHLVSAGLLPVDWPLVVAVSAIAPLVLWRVHRLSEPAAEPPEAVTSTVMTAVQMTARPVPEVVPSGVRMLPVVARTVTTPPPAVPATRPVPQAVPAGVRLLPLVSTEVTTPKAPPVPVEPPTVTLERLTPAAGQVVTRPVTVEAFRPIAWPTTGAPGATVAVRKMTAAAPAQEPRQVVTVPVTITPSELRKQARALNRQVVTETGRPVTIERLRDEYGLSRRDATDLRRHIVDGSRS